MSRATVVKDWLENNEISSSDIAAIESSGLLSTHGLFQEVTDTALNELLKVRHHIQLNATAFHPNPPQPPQPPLVKEAKCSFPARAKIIAGLKGIRGHINAIQGDNLVIVQAHPDSRAGLLYWVKVSIFALLALHS